MNLDITDALEPESGRQRLGEEGVVFDYQHSGAAAHGGQFIKLADADVRRTGFAHAMHSGRRILVAVEPTVLASALAGVLAETGDDVEVIDLRVPGSRPSAHYDAAVVNSVQPDLDADRVVELPDSEGGPGMARVWTGTHCEDVDLQGLDDLLRVLRT